MASRDETEADPLFLDHEYADYTLNLLFHGLSKKVSSGSCMRYGILDRLLRRRRGLDRDGR